MGENIRNRPVREIMNSPVRTVEYDMPSTDAARILRHNDIGSLVVEGDGIEGIVTESDIVEAVAAELDTSRLTVGQLMTRDVVTIDAEESTEIACERMQNNDVKKLPVTEDGELVGIVTTTDTTHALVPTLDDVVASFQ